MTKLALKVQPSPFETASSWVSRLATRYGCSHGQDLVHDMGFSWKRLRAGDPITVTGLCDLVGVPSDDLIRHTYRVEGLSQNWIGAEWIAPKQMRPTLMSVCPACVKEAQGDNIRYLAAGAPAWWQIEGLNVCPVHNVRLIELPAPARGRCRYDYAGRVRDHKRPLNEAAQSPVRSKASEFDNYVIGRLCWHKDGTSRWIDGLDIATVIHASQDLGLVLLGKTKRRSKVTDPTTLMTASAKGFRVLAAGPEALLITMTNIAEKSESLNAGFGADFWPFSRWLERMTDRPSCVALCDVVRNFIVKNYPIAAGEAVLGKPAQQRHLHSISSSAEKAQVNFPRMRKALYAIRNEHLLPELPRPSRNLWVAASEWDPWLERFGSAITIKPAARHLGISPATFSKLVDQRELKPIASIPGMAARYEVALLDRFLADVSRDSRDMTSVPEGMIPVTAVQSSCKTGVIPVLKLLRERQLKEVGHISARAGLKEILVKVEEVLDRMEGPPLPGLGSHDTRKFLRINCQTIPWLVSEGILACEKALHPRSRKSIQLFRHEVLEDFLAKYETCGRMSRRFGMKPPYVVKELAALGVHPIQVKQSMSVIYRRRDLPMPYSQ